MKLMTRHTHLFLWFTPPMLLAAWLLYFYQPDWLLHSALMNWVALAVGIGLVLSPWGSRLLVSNLYPRHPLQTSAWLFRSLALQLGFWLFYLGMFALLDGYHPHDAPLPLDAWREPLRLSLQTFGLFPFASIALFATAFGLLSTRLHFDTYLDTTCFSSYRHVTTPLQIAMRTLGRGLTLTGLAVSSVIATLAISTLFAGPANMSLLLGLTLPSFAAAFLLLVISLRRNQSPLLTMVVQQRPTLGMLLNIIVWALLLTLIALIIPSTAAVSITPPNFLIARISQHWHVYPLLMGCIVAWLLTPLIAITLARWSYGHTIRRLVLVCLIPSALLALACTQPWFPNPHAHAAIVTLLGFFILLISLLPHRAMPLASQTYLAAGEIKHRSEVLFLTRWKQLSGVVFYFILPGGVIALSLLFSLILLPCALVILLVTMNVLRSLRQDTA